MTDPAAHALALARRHLDAIALVPRPAGGEAERAARAHCAATLRDLGFEPTETPFEFSAFPGRWATPAGGVFSGTALAIASVVGARGSGGGALLALGVALVLLASGGFWLARRGVLDLPIVRERAVNLEATRGARVPPVWLVAHLDSKSQPVPMALRVAGIVGSALCFIAALALGGAQLAGADVASLWPVVGLGGALAAVPVAASVVGARSPGAIDDASGVATVLAAAALLPRDVPAGVLLTSAEELGMAGARAWVRRWTRERALPPGVALNCDGVDDAGTLTVMKTGRSERAALALRRAAAARGIPLRERVLVPGILVDAVALADAGWSAVTVSRGTLRTLARVHTTGDRRELLDGTGIAEAAVVMADAARELASPGGR